MSTFIDGHNKTVLTVERDRIIIDGFTRSADGVDWVATYRASHPIDEIREDIEDLTAEDDGAIDRAYDQVKELGLAAPSAAAGGAE